jgi:circadian clock protein KaiC
VSDKRRRKAVEPTGDTAFDALLGGGIPARSVVIVAGEPGSGKTLMTLQLIFSAAKRGKRTLYFTTLSEPAVKLLGYMQDFDFFDEQLFETQIVMADLGREVRQSVTTALDAIAERVAHDEPDFVVIDSFKVLADAVAREPNARALLYDLAVQMASWGATTLLVGEYARDEISRGPEFGIVDGIVRLGAERQQLTSVREIEILKLRGAAHKTGTHFFDIDDSGVRFFPRVGAPEHLDADEAPQDRASTGVEGLDELLHGGLPRHGSTLMQGGTGTGKTLLALQFLIEGARRGERGMLYTLEETPSQLRANARSLGWDLAALEEKGMLAIRYTSPVELSTDRYLYEAINELRSLGTTRAVLDSLTTMSLGVPSERRFKEMIYAITKHLRAIGITSMMTVETPQLLGSAQLTGEGVSFISDNVIQLRYIEIEGRLERAISVLKARGIHHESELRSMTIDRGGIQITSGRFRDMRGVLTGIPAQKGGA